MREWSSRRQRCDSGIFLSWAHRDRKLREALLADLLPALGMLRDIRVEWWEDSHLSCGEDLTPGIVERLRSRVLDCAGPVVCSP